MWGIHSPGEEQEGLEDWQEIACHASAFARQRRHTSPCALPAARRDLSLKLRYRGVELDKFARRTRTGTPSFQSTDFYMRPFFACTCSRQEKKGFGFQVRDAVPRLVSCSVSPVLENRESSGRRSPSSCSLHTTSWRIFGGFFDSQIRSFAPDNNCDPLRFPASATVSRPKGPFSSAQNPSAGVSFTCL